MIEMGDAMTMFRAVAVLALVLLCSTARAANYPVPKEGEWVARDFRFHTGEVMPELKLHYTTVGEPTGVPVVVLHGSGGSGASMLTPAFAGELFGPGQPLDATKHYIILPDALGHGKSAKPSDGLRTKFPRYNYTDMVVAQYRLLTEGLGISHVRVIIGNSMGGMQAWLWGQKYPKYMDALVPMASQPTAMSTRNWLLQRMMLEIVRNDPDYHNGNYVTQPQLTKVANVLYGLATAGGTLTSHNLAPAREKIDEFVDSQLAAPINADANDLLWQWASCADYDASAGLDKIEATVFAINSTDDERNPPEAMARIIKQIRSGRLFLILTSDETSGHHTTAHAKFYKGVLHRLMDAVARRAGGG
jgi:homoserine O-acetyltransferase/O-succinyltransferase